MYESTVVLTDAVAWMHAQPESSFDLIIADPPYNVGKDYGVTVDKKEREEYLHFTRSWIKESVRLLKPNGTIYVFAGFKFISYVYDFLQSESEMRFNTWICWHYTQGKGRRRGYSARHDDILMFTKSDSFTFNLDDIRIPQKHYRSVNNMRGANPGDVWEFSHIHYCQNNRQKHPTQKPEGLVERMVLASSNRGDRVLDPFCGSGTTLRVCQQLFRTCIGLDINPEYVEMTESRLEEPFGGFDSIDPRMRRVPLDLNDAKIREAYVESHIKWFLKNHRADIKAFKREVERIYGTKHLNGRRRKHYERPIGQANLFDLTL